MSYCTRCEIEKPKMDFHKDEQRREGIQSVCKECNKADQRLNRAKTFNKVSIRYERTPQGHLMRTYRNMKSRVTGIQYSKAHLYQGKTLLDKEAFYQWANSSSDYFMLFEAWVASGYNRKLTPSIDRINANEGYEISNMRWVTHSRNSSLGAISRNRKYI